MIQVVWEESAQDRHEAWALQIAINFGLSSAQAYLLEIQTAQEHIAEFPLNGADFKSPGRPHLKRLVISSGYSLFYELDSLDQPTIAVIVSVIRGQESQP